MKIFKQTILFLERLRKNRILPNDSLDQKFPALS